MGQISGFVFHPALLLFDFAHQSVLLLVMVFEVFFPQGQIFLSVLVNLSLDFLHSWVHLLMLEDEGFIVILKITYQFL